MALVGISGTGLFTPPFSVSNDELVASFNAHVDLENERNAEAIRRGDAKRKKRSSAPFIMAASGIGRRYVMDRSGVLDPRILAPRIPERTNAEPSLQCEIGVAAARDALVQAGATPDSVGAVIVACSNLQRAYPAVSIEIQSALGARGFAFDMNVACSSAAFGIAAARDMVASGEVKRALVISPEICSAHLNFRDRASHFIFGDACTAVVVEDVDGSAAAELFAIRGIRRATQFSNNIRNNSGFLNRTAPEHRDDPDKLFVQNGPGVARDVPPIAAHLIRAQLDQLGIPPSALRRLWLHQANGAMNAKIGREVLGRDPSADELPSALAEYANTSSAGSIIAFHKHRDGLRVGDFGILCAFGAGYSVGSIVLEKIRGEEDGAIVGHPVSAHVQRSRDAVPSRNVQIKPVGADAALLGDFVELPWSIYPGKHPWVPPFRAELTAELRPDNPFFEQGEAELFVALVDGKIVGRISASVDGRLADPAVGHFGYFECIDDANVAMALLRTAEQWLKARGKTIIHGPVNATVYQGYRMQTDGFDAEPWIGEPRNPHYYPRLIEQAGYLARYKWVSYDVPGVNARELIPQLEAAASEFQEEFEGYTFEPFDPNEVERDLEDIYGVFMGAFSTNYGFYQADVKEYVSYNTMASRILCYENSFKVRNSAGELVAFTRSQKNPIEAFLEADGDSSRLSPRPDTNRRVSIQHTTAVKHGLQGGGLLYMMGVHCLKDLFAAGYENWAVALVKDGTRTFMDRVAPVNRRYAIYSRMIGS